MVKKMTDIYFYSRKVEYGWLSNFHRSQQEVDSIFYPTNEHYYQSEKAKECDISEWIGSAPNPYLAMKAGQSLRKHELKENWDIIKVEIMLKGLRAKFSQNQELKAKLIATYPAALHEDSPSDKFWGVKGKDVLGRLLMQVREELMLQK